MLFNCVKNFLKENCYKKKSFKIESTSKSGRVKSSRKNNKVKFSTIGQNLCELGQRQAENIGRRNNATQKVTTGGIPCQR